MRNLIFGVAALLAVGLPSLAQADVGGRIALTAASIDDDFAASKDNVVAFSGVVITDLSASGWRLQANGASADVDAYNDSFAYSQGELHVVYDMGQFQVGAFTGMANLNGYNFYEYGVEGAYNFSRGQIAASVAGASSPNSDLEDFVTATVMGTFNVTDNVSVGASVSSTDSDDFDDNINSWAVRADYAIPNTNFTIGAGYRSSDFDDNTVTFAGLMLAWNFGEGVHRAMPGAAAIIPDAIAIQ